MSVILYDWLEASIMEALLCCVSAIRRAAFIPFLRLLLISIGASLDRLPCAESECIHDAE